MKLLKTLTLGLIAAVSLTSLASAQTVVHVAGSTAFRNAACAAIVDYLAQGGKTVHAAYYYVEDPTIGGGSAPSNALGADGAIFADGTIGSGGTATTIISAYWTGSLAGVVDLVAGNQSGAYLDITNSTVISGVNAATVATSNYAGGTYLGFSTGTGAATIATVTSVPDFVFSDSVKSTISKVLATAKPLIAPIGSYTSISTLATAVGGSTVVDAGTQGSSFVGIVPFQWVIGNAADSTVKSAISNISQQTANGLLATGYIPQSYLTGGSSANDTANYFYLVGRNEDSGTRIDSFSEVQFPVTKSPLQFQIGAAVSGNPSGAGQSTTELFPATALNTEPNITWNATGHSGYATGFDIRNALNLSEPSTAVTFGPTGGKSAENTGASYFIGYLGVTDASKVSNGKALSYNGVPFSVAAVQNGQYTLWGYEHLYTLSSISGTAKTVANFVADQVYLLDADVAGNGTHSAVSGSLAGGILDNPNSPVLVQRSLTEGGNISNY